MRSEVVERADERLNRIVGIKNERVAYRLLSNAIADELESDDQLYTLILLSEQARHIVAVRESEVGYDDPVRTNIAEFGEDLDEAIHRRANEIVAQLRASLIRQDDRWIADDPDSVDRTQVQAAMDAIHLSHRWLDDHEEVVDRLELTYPEDE
jgi:hypothetical protein